MRLWKSCHVFLLLLALFDFFLRAPEPYPLQPVYIALVHDHEPKHDRKPPERVRKRGARVCLAAKPVEPPRGAEQDSVGREAGQRERPRREPGERDERGADTRQEEHVPERDEPVLARIEHGQHAVPALRVRAAHEMRQRVEVRELPGEHQREEGPRRERIVQRAGGAARQCQQGSGSGGGRQRQRLQSRREAQRDRVCCAREEGSADGGPAHEWGDGADDGADPRVPDGAALHPRVGPCVERDVRGAQEGRGRVAHRAKERGAREARGGGKGGCVRGGEGAADERTGAGARHLRVVGDFLELVERVGGRAAERRP